MTRVHSIQYLRAIAALGVVVFHTLEASPTPFAVGAAGVDIFFVISGFIMAMLILKDEARPSTFFARRLTRIVPLYWLATIAALLITWVKPNFLYRMDASAENALLSFLFIPHQSDTGVAPVLWQGWTLEYEMFFYALCAGALMLPTARRLQCLAGLLILLATIGVTAPSSNPIVYAYTNSLLLEFVAGLALAKLWREHALPPAWIGTAMLVAGFGIYALEYARLIPVSGVRIIDWGLPALLIVGGALSLETENWVPRSRTGLAIGEASYSLYLTHGFVVTGVLWLFPGVTFWILTPVCVLCSVMVAIAVHHFIQNPLGEALDARLRPTQA
jgi:exopolysaccharide production protein ExoZ